MESSQFDIDAVHFSSHFYTTLLTIPLVTCWKILQKKICLSFKIYTELLAFFKIISVIHQWNWFSVVWWLLSDISTENALISLLIIHNNYHLFKFPF